MIDMKKIYVYCESCQKIISISYDIITAELAERNYEKNHIIIQG